MADEYAPVTTPEEEEEERRRTAAAYPAPEPASKVPDYAREATPAPDLSLAVSPQNSEALKTLTAYPAIVPRRAETAEEQMGPRPSPSDYPSPELHGWRKGLGALFTGMAAFRSPEAGEQAYKHLFVEPGERAQQEYETAVSDYDKRLAQKQSAAKETSEESLRGAQTENTRAEAEARRHPKEEWVNVPSLLGPNGEPVEQERTSGQYRFGNLPGTKQAKTPGETQEQNKLAFQGVVAKLDAAKLPTGPKDLDKSLDEALKRGAITPDEHSKARAYEAANQTPGTNLTVHVAGAQQAQGFQHNEKKEAETYKRYETAQDAEQRLSRMEASYQKALKGDQQAMLALLTDHIGMTLGLQKGARITKDILNEATASMPWLEKIESKFDSRGYLSGVTLGPEQMAQMLDLGYEARDRAVQGAQDSSKLYGVAEPPGAAEVFGKRKIGEKPALQKPSQGKWNPKTGRYE